MAGETGQKEERRRERASLTNMQIILIALMVVGGRLVIDFSQRILEGQEKQAEQRALETEIEALLVEKQELETMKAYYNSEAFVEAWAHDQGKMVRESEVLVIPIYEESGEVSSAPDTVTAPPPEALPAWRVWWSLFFDTPPPGE